MTKTFTQDDLVLFIYDEVEPSERAEIENALLCDEELADKFRELKSLVERLDHVDKRPNKKIINEVLDYAKSLSLHASHK